MIAEIIKDHSICDLNKFAFESPERYQELCRIIGEYALGVRYLTVSIELPYKKCDFGCVIVSAIRKQNINIIATRFF